MYIYINGECVLENEAKISPFDHGFLYGLGLFETFRVYNGHPFLLDDHFQRLAISLQQLNIRFDLNKKEICEIITQLLALNKLKDAYIRFNVSAGNAPIGLQTEVYSSPNVIVFIKPMPSLVHKKKAVFLNTPRNTPEGAERLKSHHYLNNIIGKREVISADTEGIFLTNNGYVAEGVVSNIFWVKENKVYTPSLQTGILNGITRQFVIELLKKNAIPITEGFYSTKDVLEADEVFITNSIQEVVTITMLNNHLFSKTNPISTWLQALYNACITEQLWSIREMSEKD